MFTDCLTGEIVVTGAWKGIAVCRTSRIVYG